MPKYIDAEKLEKDGWSASRTYQQDAKTMVYETKKMTDFPTADVPDTNVGDTISRQAAIDAIEGIDWYMQNKSKDMVQGAHGTDDAWYKATDVYKALEELPAAQPQRMRGYERVVYCGECAHMMPDGRCREFADDNIRPSASDYCSAGEKRADM